MLERDDWHLTKGVAHELGRGDPFAAAMRGTRMPMIITDPRQADNPIVFANEAFQHLTGYARDELLGRNCRFLQGRETDQAAVRSLHHAVATKDAVNVDILNYRKDGSTFWNALYVSPVRAEDGQVQFFFASQLDVTDRIEAARIVREQKAVVEEEIRLRTAALEYALEAKNTLLHEVDHRVKNNLTMIGALLRLQVRSLSDPKVAATLETMLARIDALAAVHRRFYQSDDVSRFELGEFASGLVDDVVAASGRDDLRVVKDIVPVSILAAQAAPLGLILNEVVTNAIKHAFPQGRGGTLSVRIGQGDGTISVALSDDGIGFDGAASPPGSMGRRLVSRLAKQLGADASWSSAAPGTTVTILIPVEGGAHGR